MRTPRSVKQRMKYALRLKNQPEYVKDEEGNIIYVTLPDGTTTPKVTGETKDGYSEPITFFNSISGTLTEDELMAFGNEYTGVAKITYPRGEYPFKVGTLIWKDSDVGYDEDGEIDEKSADFRVLGIMTEGQYFWRAILTGVVKNED